MVFLDSNSTVLVLGATGTLGEAIARELAKTGARMILAGRDRTKGEGLVQTITKAGNKNVRFQVVELDSLMSIFNVAAQICSMAPKIHCVINCATAVTFAPTTSVDGFELNWSVNALGPLFLLSQLKSSLVAAGTPSKKARVVNLVSKVTMMSKIIEIDISHVLNPKESYRFSPLNCFLVSKIEQRMLTYTLAAEWGNLPITVNCCHPGFVTSMALKYLGFRQGIDTLEQSIATPVAAVLSNKYEGISGEYIEDDKIVDCSYKRDRMRQPVWNVCTERLNNFVTTSINSNKIPSSTPIPFPPPSSTTSGGKVKTGNTTSANSTSKSEKKHTTVPVANSH